MCQFKLTQTGRRPDKATKLDVLELIMKRKLLWWYELEEKFGYSPR
jgi:hypothetical protein